MGVPGGGFSHWKNSSTTDIDSWRCDIDNPRRCSSDDSDIPSRQGKFSSRSSPGCALHDDFSPFPPLNEHASQQTLSPAVTILNYLNALAERSTDLPIARDSQAISPDQHILCKPPNGSLHLPDMIGAVLYNHSPRSLEAFLIRDDDKIFHFHRRSQNGPGQLEFGIVRESNIVTCGYQLNNHTDNNNHALCNQSGLWYSKHIYRMGDGPTEAWTPLMCQRYCFPDEHSRLTIWEMGRLFAGWVLENEVWEEGKGETIEVYKV